MTPGEEQSIARLLGRVEGKVDELGRTMDRALNALDKKADKKALEDTEGRVDSLEATRDKGGGRNDLIKGAIGAVLSLIGIFAANGGHL